MMPMSKTKLHEPTPLCYLYDHINCVTELLAVKNMYVNLVNDFDEPQLFVAVSFGKVEFVTALLAYADVTVNAIDNSGNTLL